MAQNVRLEQRLQHRFECAVATNDVLQIRDQSLRKESGDGMAFRGFFGEDLRTYVRCPLGMSVICFPNVRLSSLCYGRRSRSGKHRYRRMSRATAMFRVGAVTSGPGPDGTRGDKRIGRSGDSTEIPDSVERRKEQQRRSSKVEAKRTHNVDSLLASAYRIYVVEVNRLA